MARSSHYEAYDIWAHLKARGLIGKPTQLVMWSLNASCFGFAFSSVISIALAVLYSYSALHTDEGISMQIGEHFVCVCFGALAFKSLFGIVGNIGTNKLMNSDALREGLERVSEGNSGPPPFGPAAAASAAAGLSLSGNMWVIVTFASLPVWMFFVGWCIFQIGRGANLITCVTFIVLTIYVYIIHPNHAYARWLVVEVTEKGVDCLRERIPQINAEGRLEPNEQVCNTHYWATTHYWNNLIIEYRRLIKDNMKLWDEASFLFGDYFCSNFVLTIILFTLTVAIVQDTKHFELTHLSMFSAMGKATVSLFVAGYNSFGVLRYLKKLADITSKCTSKSGNESIMARAGFLRGSFGTDSEARRAHSDFMKLVTLFPTGPRIMGVLIDFPLVVRMAVPCATATSALFSYILAYTASAHTA